MSKVKRISEENKPKSNPCGLVDNKLKEKTFVDVFEVDGSKRQLLVPNPLPNDVPGVLSDSLYKRLKESSKVITPEMKIKMREDAAKERERLTQESHSRKTKMAKAFLPQNRLPGKLSDAESENCKRNSYLLQRSRDLILEQDERVKIANGIILATKCRAIRNAQMAEKEMIKKELEEENLRLDRMMEQERLKKIELENAKAENIKRKNQMRKEQIEQQIKANEVEKLLEGQRIEEESKMINQALVALQKQEEKRLLQKKLEQKKMREQFKKANDEAEFYKNLQEEEQRIADLRVREFMRQKAEREEAREKELAQTKQAKEQEINRLRAQQEKASDYQAMMDELNALRTQEEKEKEWRDKEMQEATKRKQQDEDLKAARAKQIEDIKHTKETYLRIDEDEYHKALKVQQEQLKKEQEKLQKRKETIAKHRLELLGQIHEKEEEKICLHKQRFEEGRAQRLEFDVKDKSIEEYLKNKVANLREKNVPENYIKDIERQLKMKP